MAWAAAARAADPMALSFSWAGVKGCTEEARSPSFEVLNAPADTRFLVFALTDADGHKNRGQYVNYPPAGKVQPGAVSYQPPCRPGPYRWTITATDRAGTILATATAERLFPSEVP